MGEPYPVELYPGCPCLRCDLPTWTANICGHPIPERMSLCPTCGSKRCPGAVDHIRATCAQTSAQPEQEDRK